MTASVLSFRTEMALPAAIENGNPDIVSIVPAFTDAEQASTCISALASATASSQGEFSAQALQRLATQAAGHVVPNEFGGAAFLVRTIAQVARPSGRITGHALAHLAIHGERTTTPEGTYIVLRIAAPSVHTVDQGEKTEVLEATLLTMLEQAEDAADALVAHLYRADSDIVVWNLPIRHKSTALMQDLNARLLQRLFVSPTPRKFLKAA